MNFISYHTTLRGLHVLKFENAQANQQEVHGEFSKLARAQ